MQGKVFIVVEDVYAPPALRHILRKRGIHNAIINHLGICSKKMERVVRAHLREGRHVVIIADAEQEHVKNKEKWIRESHKLGNNVTIIVIDPCIEALACEALGLKGCREKPCNNGPIRAIDTYFRREKNKEYQKRLLPLLLKEADKDNKLDQVPEFKKLIKTLKDP